MEFRLVYEGKLGSNKPKQKQLIRRHFHPQLKELWQVHPQLKGEQARTDPSAINHHSILESNFGFVFAPLVTKKLSLLAELKILLLRPGNPGNIVSQGGDIDNRIKTLLDALRMPQHANELSEDEGPQDGEVPFYCLLQDDSLITSLAVDTDRLLTLNPDPSQVFAVIHVTTRFVPSANTQVNATSF